MEELVTVINFDWRIATVVFVMLVGAIVGIWKNIDYLKTKFGIRTRHDEERDLLLATADNLSKLQERHAQDNEMLKEELRSFTQEIRDAIASTQQEVSEYKENRVHDREHSFSIQRELTDNMKEIADGGKRRDEQIQAITAGNRELLGNALDQKFDKYIELQGIPSDELDEFVSLHDAYKGCGGNHRRDSKFDYVMTHLSVLPVKTIVDDLQK